MNSTDSNDDWNNDHDFLSGAFRGAADEMPGGEVDDLHVSYGVVRDRVRRRRAAKIGGLAGVSLVLVGGIAFGTTQTSMLDRGAPVAPGSSHSAFMSPDVSRDGTVTEAPEPRPSGSPATSVIQEGYTPTWLEDIAGADLRCGMPVTDLVTTAQGWSVAASGDIYARTTDPGGAPWTSWGMAATVQRGEGTLGVPPVLVWSQDGVVVDFGANVFGAPIQGEPLLGTAEAEVEAQGNSATTCAPMETEPVDLMETPLPEGDYEVRVVAFPEVVPGRWAAAVSKPVAVRLDAEGAHTPTGTRGDDATIEPPAPADGEQSRFVLDRSTEWVTAGMTHRAPASTDPMTVTAQCESTDPADTVPFDIVRQSNQQLLGSGDIACDGAVSEISLGVLDGAEEKLDIRLPEMPDGVARLWAVLAPTATGGNSTGGDSSDGGDAAADCSASGLDLEYDLATAPSEGAGATARSIVEAAQACDSGRLVELANQHGTQLMFTTETAEQTFALPDTDTQHYRTLVTLLAGTGGAVAGASDGVPTVVWPRVSTEEFRDSDEAWQEVVEAGLLTQGQADAQRADETFGYTGMVIGIGEDGTWRYYSPSE
jgi:hypothetical protein